MLLLYCSQTEVRLNQGGRGFFFITNHLITREGGFNCELKSEGEDAESEEAEEGAGDQDVDAHVGHEQQVGEDEHANNSSQTAQLGDLHNFASLLKVKKTLTL